VSNATVNDFLDQERNLLNLGKDPAGSNHNEITKWYGMDGPWCAMTTPAFDHLNKPIVGAAPTPDRKGLYLTAADGGVFTFGDARFAGSRATHQLNAPIVGIATHPLGGYWLVGADGGIFGEGVPFMGCMASIPMNAPVVGLADRPQGDGYWLVGADGDATFEGSVPDLA
jgi:hypothetical protein